MWLKRFLNGPIEHVRTKTSVHSPRRRLTVRYLRVEPLEDRRLLSVSYQGGDPLAPAAPRISVPTGLTSAVPEPMVTVNAADPGNLAISNQSNLLVTTDLGANFAGPTNFNSLAGVTASNGDTDTAFDSQGRLFWTNLDDPGPGRNVAVSQMNATTAAQIGSATAPPNPAAEGDDKQFFVADTDPFGISPFADNLYLSFDRFNSSAGREWEVFVSASTDQAGSWSAPVRVSDSFSEGFVWPSDVAVAPGGDVYVAYHSQPDINDAELEGAAPGAANPDGTSGQTYVLRSSNGGVDFDQQVTLHSDDIGVIPDTGSTVYFDLPIENIYGTVQDVDVHVDITHDFDDDLDVFLISPVGTRIELFTDVGGAGNNFTNTTLDDEASTSITAASAPFAGRFQPEDILSGFDGEDVTGTWQLEITDDFAGFAGSLNSWGLTIDVGNMKTKAFLPGESDVSYNRQDVPGGVGLVPGARYWLVGSVQPWVLPDPVRSGNVYVISNDDPDNVHGSGDEGDVVFARSTDYGVSWEQWTLPVDATDAYQFFPNAAIDEFGNIVVSWYDTRRGLTNGNGNFLLDTYATYSTDGGDTWAPAFMISDPANPLDPDVGVNQRFPANGSPFNPANLNETSRIGEYQGIDVFGGTAYVVASANNSGGGGAPEAYLYTFPLNGSLTINGDDGGAVVDDTIVIRNIAGNPDFIEVLVNGNRQYAGLRDGVAGGITVNGLGGDDTLTIDYSNGDPLPASGLRFEGGPQTGVPGDQLVVIGNGSNHGSYTPDSAIPGNGSLDVDDTEIIFTGLEPVLVNGFLEFSYVTPNSNDVIAVDSPAAGQNRVSGTSGGIAFEPITLFDVGHFLIDTATNDAPLGDPNDTVNFSADLVAAGLVSFTINTGAGNDDVDAATTSSVGVTVLGGSGDDTLTGGAANDRLEGGAGLDTLNGGGGSDTLLGGSDRDILIGGTGNDLIDGGDDPDTYVFHGTAGDDNVLARPGTETPSFGPVMPGPLVEIENGAELDVIGDIEELVIDLNLGAVVGDTVTILPLAGTELEVLSIDKGAGTGTVTIEGSDAAEELSIVEDTENSNLEQIVGFGPRITLHEYGPDDSLIVNGNGGDDVIKADGAVNDNIDITLDGGTGNDFLSADAVLIGGPGNDVLIGGAGNDTMDGGAGDDVFVGNGGTDAITGGSGADTILVEGSAGDDTIHLSLNGVGALVADVNGNITTYTNGGGGAISAAGLEAILIESLAGNDVVYVDVNGTPLISVPITYNGGAGNDTLNVSGTPTNPVTSTTYIPGPGDTEGELFYDSLSDMRIRFTGLEPVFDFVPAAALFVNGTNGDDAINYGPGTFDPVNDGRISINNFETIEFSNKTTLVLNGLAGSDAVHLDNPNSPAGLTSITVNGGDPTDGSDTVVVNGALNVEDTIAVALIDHDSATVDITVDPSGANVVLPTVNVNEAELLIVNGQTGDDALTIAGTNDQPTDYLHTPGATTDAGRVDSELDGVAADPFLPVEYAALGDGSLTLELNGDADLTVLGTDVDDDFLVEELAGAQARITHTVEPSLGFVRIPIFADEIGEFSAVVVDGLEGDDDIWWHLGPNGEDILYVTARGGDPGGSDVFTIVGETGVDDDITIIPGVTTDSGGYRILRGGSGITHDDGFTGIELVRVEANGGDADTLTVQGTGRSDAMKLIRGDEGDRIEGSFQVPVEAVGEGVFDTITVDLDAGGNSENDALTVDLTELQAAVNYEVIGDVGEFDELVLLGTNDVDQAEVVQTGTQVEATIDRDPGAAGDENTIQFAADQIGLLTVTTLASGDEISVAGGGVADTVTVPIRIEAGDGNDEIELSDLAVNATVYAGAGDDLVDGSGVADDDVQLTLLGEEGNDNLIGGDSPTGAALGDLLDGGTGNDRLEGGRGQDRFFGGDGSDLFVWVAGDGSDLMEGGAGDSDAMLFDALGGDNRLELFGGGLFGATVNPAPNVFGPGTLENGSRSIFALNSAAQDSAAVFLNMADVEDIHIAAGDGNDQIIINNQADTTSSGGNPIQLGTDLASTAVQSIEVDLGIGDGSADNMEVHGQLTGDDVNVSVDGGTVDVAGFVYSIRIISPEAGNDRLFVHGQTGDDSIKAEPGVEATIAITLEGDAGNDYLSADAILIGGPGDDFLEGGPGDDQLFGNAGEDTMVGNGGNDTYDGGPDFDTILVRGTSADDRIDLRQDSATQLRYEVGNASNGFDGILGGAGTETDTLVIATVEQVRIDAGAGDDTMRVEHDDALVAAGVPENMLRIDVLGGQPGASDRLTVLDDGLGDTTIQRIGGNAGDGSFTMYAFSGGNPVNPIIAMPPVIYTAVEYASLEPMGPVTGGTGADGNGRLFVFKHDPFEQNPSLPNATFLGANETTNVDPTIDPGVDVPFGTPGDEDWYRIVAEVTGTLDIQAYYRQQGTLDNGRAGLPGDGDLDIALYDADGLVNGAVTPIAGTGAFGTNDTNDDERIRIPAIAGQTYYLRVVGAPVPIGDAQNESPAINIYNLSVVNVEPPTPFDLELADNLTILTADQEVPAVVSAANGTANFEYDAVANTFDLDLFVYGVELTDTTAFPEITGSHIHAGATGVNGPVIVTLSIGSAGWVQEPAGIRLRLDDAPFSAVAADITALLAGETYINVHTTANPAGEVRGQILIPNVLGVTDTGRSQFGDVTQDDTPTIFVRLDDAILLNDLPGNAAGTPDAAPPDEVIPIPHNPATAASPVGLDAGYRVAIYDEIDTHAPVFLGFAQPVANLRGVYSFTFVTPLPDGSHFISARVQMIDPADNDANALTLTPATGFGPRSDSLEFVVDTVPPPVLFGTAAEPFDGLHPDSDTGIEDQPATFVDRITSDTTPSFWGAAEADAIVHVYADLNGNGILDVNTDLLLGKTVAVPLDGTNQYPNGQWNMTTNIDMNDPAFFPVIDGTRTIFAVAADLAGNVTDADNAQILEVFVDTRGPQVDGVEITTAPAYDLFDPKPSTDGPTPLVFNLDIDFIDRPPRDAPFVYPAVNEILATAEGNIVLVGDYNGVIPIESIDFIDSTVDGGLGMTTVRLNFFEPLPDDRYTLTVSDRITDDAFNALDGESHAQEPQEIPIFPSGDGVPGEDFFARFTIDSRPEVASYAAGSVWADTNGNGFFDPDNLDYTNRDIIYNFGFTSDDLFVGNFVTAAGASADGFDKLAAYGRVPGGGFRWLVDTDNNGVPNDLDGDGNQMTIDPLQLNGLPVAGRFDNNDLNGDEVGLYTAEPTNGSVWYFDTNHDSMLDAGSALSSELHGVPIVGDFDGDGFDDLGAWEDDTFEIDLAGGVRRGWDGIVDVSFRYGFIGVREQPVVADVDQDGFDDLGLWVPDRSGVTPSEGSEWYILVSDGASVLDRIVLNADLGVPAVDFTPVPFGPDLYMQFGDEYAMPLLGNFDPPVTPTGVVASGVFHLEGTEGDDEFFFDAGADGQTWTVTVNGTAQAIPENTTLILFDGLGGQDIAFLRGSDGSELFASGPAGATLSGTDFAVTVQNVEITHGYGMGGNDHATLQDSSGNDKFKAKFMEDYAKMMGGGHFTRAKFFETVSGVFSEGEDDYARVWDTNADDAMTVSPSELTLTGGGFTVNVQAFDRLLAYSTYLGDDTVDLYDSPGDDILRARSHKTLFWGPGFDMTLRRWEEVRAHADNGGYDVAKLHDTLGDDVLLTGEDWANLSTVVEEDLDLLYTVYGFELVKGYHTEGNDKAPSPATVDFLMLHDEAGWELE